MYRLLTLLACAFACLPFTNADAQSDSILVSDQAPKSFINGELYSTLIELQTFDGAINIGTGYEAAGLSSITDAGLRNVLEQAMLVEGLDPTQLHIRKCRLEEVLSGNDLKNIYFVTFPGPVNISNLLDNLRGTSGVKHAQKPYTTYSLGGIPFTDVGDPNNSVANWHLASIQASNGWVFMQDLASTQVGLMEPNGRVDFNNPEFVGNISNYNSAGPDDYDNFSGAQVPLSEHATGVAAMFASEPNTNPFTVGANQYGVVPVTFDHTQVASHCFSGDCDGNLLDALYEFIVAQTQNGVHPDVLNLSFIFLELTPVPNTNNVLVTFQKDKNNVLLEMNALTNLMQQEDVMVVAGTGNEMCAAFVFLGPGQTPIYQLNGFGYPMGLPGVIGAGGTAVESTGINEHAAGGGKVNEACETNAIRPGEGYNYNIDDSGNPAVTFPNEAVPGYLEITAPAFDISTTVSGNINGIPPIIVSTSGTSLAAPQAGALLAMMKFANPQLTNQEVETILFETADKLGYNPNGISAADLTTNNTNYTAGYRYDNGGEFPDQNLDWQMGYGRLNYLSAMMNTRGLAAGGFTLSLGGAFAFADVTVENVNDHSVLFSLGAGNYNELYEYDAILNQAGAVVRFDGAGASFEIAEDATFRLNNDVSLEVLNGADLILQPGSGVAVGDASRIVIHNEATLRLANNNFTIPANAIIEVKSGGILIIDDANLLVESGGSLVIRDGGTLLVEGTGLVTVQNDGWLCVEQLATVNLVQAGIHLDLLSVYNNGPNPITGAVSSNCVCPYNIVISGAGTLNVFFAPISASITASTGPGCNCSGSLTVGVTGGYAASSFGYQWDDPTNQTAATATNLCPGTYAVTVTDDYGCAAQVSDVITPLATTMTLTFSSTDVLCAGGADGTASVAVTGNVGAVTYLWSTGSTTSSATNLAAGYYTLTVDDGNSCASGGITINEPTQIQLSTSVQPACFGAANGSASVVASGGTPPYTYLWSDGQTTATASNLAAGSYTVDVTDANNCIETAMVMVAQPTQGLSAVTVVTDVSCNGLNDGEATVTMSGGTPPYTYLWNDPAAQTTATATNLLAGSYTLTVTDAAGCVDLVNINVNGPSNTPLIFVFSVTDLSCNVASQGSYVPDGVASVTVSGGTPPYTYLWSDGQTTSTATGLVAGTYYVTVIDDNGLCESASVVVNQPSPVSVSFSITNATCAGLNDGEIIASVSGGSGIYFFSWAYPGSQPGPIVTQNFPNAEPGFYSLAVADGNFSCIYAFNTAVSGPLPAAFTLSSSTTAVTACGSNDGTATVNITGGTGPFTYQWNDPLGQTTATATNLAAGTYTVVVTDAVGGCASLINVIVDDAVAITIPVGNFTVQQVSCLGGSDGAISVAATGGTPPYTYVWDDPAITVGPNVSNLVAGQYTVTITDANGCVGTVLFGINQPIYSLGVSAAITHDICDDLAGAIDITDLNCDPNGNGVSFMWSNGATTEDISNLGAGTYVLDITCVSPFFGTCVQSHSFTINSFNYDVINQQIVSGQTENWISLNRTVNGTITVEDGAVFNIVGSNIQFGENGQILVEAGGRLNVDNSVLTNNAACAKMWKGIEVWGDITQPHPTDPFAPNNPHGFVNIQNGTLIENAHNGIYVGDLLVQSADFGAGGIVWCEDSEIKNCRYSVFYKLYNTKNISQFINTDFTNDQPLIDPIYLGGNTQNHMRIFGSAATGGFLVQGCTFSNTTGAPLDERSAGIVIVGEIRKSRIQDNTFTTMSVAVRGNFKSTRFLSNTFDGNARGMTLKAGILSEFIGNQYINIPAPDLSLATPFETYGIFMEGTESFYVEGNTFDGTFSMDPTLSSYGMIVDNNGKSGGIIFDNTFNGTDIGFQGQGDNRVVKVRCNDFAASSTAHDEVSWTVLVDQQSGLGLFKDQGNNDCNNAASLLQDQQAAGNLFLDNCPASPTTVQDIFVELGINWLYYAHDEDINGGDLTKPECSQPTWEPASLALCNVAQQPNSCNNAFQGKILADPNTNLEQYLLEIKDAIDEYENEIAALQALIDGGNTANLIAVIQGTGNPNQKTAELLLASPYLSDQVLIEVINSDLPSNKKYSILAENAPLTSEVLLELLQLTPAFPSNQTKDILLLSTPLDDSVLLAFLAGDWSSQTYGEVLEENSPLSDDVLLALLQPTPALPNAKIKDVLLLNTPLSPAVEAEMLNVLPQGMSNQVLGSTFEAEPHGSIPNVPSARELLERQIAWYQDEIQLLLSAGLRQTEFQDVPVQAAALLQEVQTLEAEKLNAYLQLAEKDYAGCSQSLTNIATNANWHTEANDQDFCTVMQQKLDLAMNGQQAYQMTTAQEQALNTVVSNANTPSTEGKTVLELGKDATFTYPIDPLPTDWDKRNSDSSELDKPSFADSDKGALEFALYPNPSSGVVTVHNYGKLTGLYTIVVHDLTGKQVSEHLLSADSESTTISFDDLANGLYIYQIRSGSKVVASGKLNIIR